MLRVPVQDSKGVPGFMGTMSFFYYYSENGQLLTEMT